MSKKGAGVSPFLLEVTDEKVTFLFPIADHSAGSTPSKFDNQQLPND